MNIKELRTEKKLSQAAFAKSIGVSVSSIASYEAGKTVPAAKTLAKIQEVYGVEIAVEAPAKKAEKPAKKAEKKAPAKKAPAKKAAPAQVIIQSPMGGEISPEDILAKIGNADRVYVRVDENKAYWVRGEENGSIELW